MVDTSIIMQAANLPRVDLAGALQRGAESAAAIESIPVQQRALEAQTASSEQMVQAREAQEGVRKAQILHNYATQLKLLPMAQRRTYLATIPDDVLSDVGIDADQIKGFAIDDASIDATIGQLAPLVQQASGQVGARRSESLAGGRITVQELDDGTVRYLEFGQEIPSDQVRERVAEAQRAYTEDQRQISGARRGGALGEELEFKPQIARETTRATESEKDVQEFISEAAPKISAIENNIANYDEVIEAIDAGARTGAIVSRLPSINEASKSLDNLRTRLGLDVVSMASFGALSESEMDIALSSALPTNKSPEALREWVVSKQNAQRKAAEALRDAVSFLNNGGTIGELIEIGRPQKTEAEAESPSPKRLVFNPETGMLE